MRQRELLFAWTLLGCMLVPDFLDMGVRARVVTALPWGFVAGILASPLAPRVAARTLEPLVVPRVRMALIGCGGLCLASIGLFGLFGGIFLLVLGIAGYVVVMLILPTRAAGSILVAGVATALTVTTAGLAAEVLVRRPAFEQRYGGPAVRTRTFLASDRIWEHNVFGFRSPYERLARQPSVFRILALGGGYTYADHIPGTADTWPSQLEVDLRRRYPGRAVEVINMGRGAYTTANVGELLRRLGWQFDPDLVVVEFDPNQGRVSRPDFGHDNVAYITLLPDRFRRGLIRSSALLYFIEARYGWLQSRGLPYTQYLPYFESGAKGYAQVLEALREMGDSARARRVPVILMLFPDLIPGTWSADRYPFRQADERIAQIGAQAGMTVLDLLPVFASQHLDGRHWWAAPYSSNPNEAALRLAALTLADFIAQCGWLDEPRGSRSSRLSDAKAIVPPQSPTARACPSPPPNVAAGTLPDTTGGPQLRRAAAGN